MPNINVHCAISKKRTGDDFKRLHEWIDRGSQTLGVNHRILKHAFNINEEHKIREFFQEQGVIEWLFHIALDNLETAFKLSKKTYGKNTYNHLEFTFLDNGYIKTKFSRKALISSFQK